MLGKCAIAMGSRDDLQAPISRCRGVDGNPYRTRCKWFYRPILTILMPRCFGARSGRLGKEAGIPESNIITDQLRNHGEDFACLGHFKKIRVVGQ